MAGSGCSSMQGAACRVLRAAAVAATGALLLYVVSVATASAAIAGECTDVAACAGQAVGGAAQGAGATGDGGGSTVGSVVGAPGDAAGAAADAASKAVDDFVNHPPVPGGGSGVPPIAGSGGGGDGGGGSAGGGSRDGGNRGAAGHGGGGSTAAGRAHRAVGGHVTASTPAVTARSIATEGRAIGASDVSADSGGAERSIGVGARSSGSIAAAGRVAAQVAFHVALPLLILLALVASFVAVQDRLDRRDPKLVASKLEHDVLTFQ